MSHEPKLAESELLCETPLADRERSRTDEQRAVAAAEEGAADRGEHEPQGAGAAVDPKELEHRIIEALRTIFDPEIPVNIYDLGLIYKIDVLPLGRVNIHMTLTSPACPVAGQLPPEVEAKARTVDGVSDASVELVWEPPWTMDRMSEEARLELNLF